MLDNIRIRFDRTTILGLLICATIIAALTDLAFSIRTYHDMIIFGLMTVSFIYNLYCDIKQDKQSFICRLKQIFAGSAKWLFIAVGCYYVYDLISIIYTKDMYHALKKLPYMLEYTVLFLASVYYIKQRRELTQILFSIGISGTIVSVCTYFYYAFSLRPIYFQRLSTARDYNVYACLILFTFIVIAYLIVHLLKTSFIKKLVLFVFILLVNMPTFYFAGSRRMFIMLPYFFAFTVVFEFSRLLVSWFKSIKMNIAPKKSLDFLRLLAFFVVTVVLYFGCIQLLPTFTEIGTQKEANYNKVIKEQAETDKKPSGGNTSTGNESSEKTISNVLETIDDKSMFNKRSIIYNTAFEELKGYSVVDLIFGRGSAYDIHMFDVTDNQELLTAYKIDENNIRPKGWMSSHNFMIADILNGGLIKLLLGFFVVIQIIVHVIKSIKIQQKNALLLVVPVSLVLINSFISGAYGMLNDLFFYSAMIAIVGVLCYSQKANSAIGNDNATLYRNED